MRGFQIVSVDEEQDFQPFDEHHPEFFDDLAWATENEPELEPEVDPHDEMFTVKLETGIDFDSWDSLPSFEPIRSGRRDWQ